MLSRNGCLLNCLFRHRSNKTSKLRVTGLCVGNSPVTCEYPAAVNSQHSSYLWFKKGKPPLNGKVWGVFCGCFEPVMTWAHCHVLKFSRWPALWWDISSWGLFHQRFFSAIFKFDGNFALLLFHCWLSDRKLSCHVQNFVVITVLKSRWEWNGISIKF